MVHDRELLERLTAFSPIIFDSEVFRATRRGLNPVAPSLTGGRWMVANEAPTLYTSSERDGALAEIAFHWIQLTPPDGVGQIEALHSLSYALADDRITGILLRRV